MKYTTKRKIYKREWSRKHRKQLSKTRKIHRVMKKQYVRKLEQQVKLIPKLKNKISNLQNELANSKNSRVNIISNSDSDDFNNLFISSSNQRLGISIKKL